MQPLRYVILGAGGISHSHVESYNRQPDMLLAGVLDINPQTLERWKQRFPEAEVEMEVQRLLDRTRPHLASVCTPNHAHCELTIAALEAGCHVLCEKPMAMTLKEAQSMERARVKAGKLGAINFSYRNVTTFRLAREIIAAGELGRIQRMNVRYLQSFMGTSATFAWRNDIGQAGFGALGDLGVHMLDGVGFLTGLSPQRLVGTMQTLIPSKPDAAGKPRKITTDTNASFLVEYDGSAVGTFETSQVIPGYGNFFHVEISGEKGVLRICSEDNDSIALYTSPTLCRYGTWRQENFPRFTVPGGFAERQPRSTMESFVKAIRGEDVHHATFADGVMAQRCLAALVESIRSGGWVKV
jgi:predicted dehydrogenase